VRLWRWENWNAKKQDMHFERNLPMVILVTIFLAYVASTSWAPLVCPLTANTAITSLLPSTFWAVCGWNVGREN
jgi:hypothetical protein